MQITKIFQISDIHIRLYKRHKEYEQVFKRLFQYIEENKTDQSIIVITGDVVHNKTDMSPEMIHLTSKFLKGCADLLPCILIPGNHDGNLSNSNRLDALTPIVNSLNHPNLQYWKDSGVYKFHGLTFSHFGIFDSPDNWVLANDIKSKYKIALHHGPVIGSHTDLTNIETGIKVGIFEGFDLVLLGDVHRFQFLNEEKTIGYSSSLICQNYGESVDEHGIIVWDLPNKRAEFVKIKNDYGYITFMLIDGKCTIPSGLPKHLRVRIKYENTTNEQLHDFISRLSKKYNIVELIKVKISSNVTSEIQKTNLGNSRNVEYQNNQIVEYLKLNPDIIDSDIDGIIAINNELNQLLNTQSIIRNIKWIPKQFEFSNMFSYGENNIFDFTDLSGIYGIFAANASGKSAFLDALTFCIYDKSTRASKAVHILNNTKDWFKCKFTFELNGKDYFIERHGYQRNNNIRVDVKFWTIDDDGSEILLNGEDRDQTNKIIRDYVGTYDDFVMTTLSTQYDNQSFVEKSQRERKDLLYKFLDISIYDDLYKVAKDQAKDMAVLIREYEKESLHEKSSKIFTQISTYEKLHDDLSQRLSEYEFKIKQLNQQLFDENKKFVPVEQNLNLTDISSSILSENSKLLQCIETIKELKNMLDCEVENNQQLEIQVVDYVPDLTISKKVQNLKQQQYDVKLQLGKIQSTIDSITEKQSHLENHQYDPNCQYCVSNPFVVSATKSIQELPMVLDTQSKLNTQLNDIETELQSLTKLLVIEEEKSNILGIIEQNKIKISKIQEKINNLKYDGSLIKNKIKQLQEQEQKYHELESILLNNENIQKIIDDLSSELLVIESERKKLQSEYNSIVGRLESNKREYTTIQNKLSKYLDLIKKYRNYDLYLDAVNRDGVPYRILETVLPVIEYGVNEILSQIVGFNVKLETNEDKYIHAYIKHNGNEYPVELTSGMERFIISLAFRTALNDITSLPKPNFLAIDEGFGVLDSENLSNLGKLFNFLKTQYDYLLCISHIDSMKDLVDSQINIEKVNGYSVINVAT